MIWCSRSPLRKGVRKPSKLRFSRRLLEALQGQADGWQGQRDGKVTLRELADYVKRNVSADSAGDAVRQVPTAGPRDLLELVEFPLGQVQPAAEAVSVSR